MNSSKRFVVLLLTSIVCLCAVSSTDSQSAVKVAGSVNDEAHAPITRAQVTLYSLDRILRAGVDSEGRFRFDNVPPGVYEFEASAGAFKTVTRHLEVPGQTSDPISLDILLPIAGTDGDCWNGDSVSYGSANGTVRGRLNGTVVEINGQSKVPVANADVALFKSDLKITERQTNERGEFDFKTVLPGRYLIVVTHPSYRELRSRTFWVSRENWTRITFDPIPLGKIRVCQ